MLAIARARGLVLLIGQDAALAARIGAHGVHLPQRLAHRALPLRRMRPDWLITAAAHGVASARASRGHAIVISPALLSRSPSAGRPLGPARLAAMVRAAGRPAYGLGGINPATARRLRATGLIGLAAVEGFGA